MWMQLNVKAISQASHVISKNVSSLVLDALINNWEMAFQAQLVEFAGGGKNYQFG